jgi:hypothetical protein
MPKPSPAVIDELYVVVGKDQEGNEGVAMGIDASTGATEPLLGSRRRIPRVLELAQALANQSGQDLHLVKFTTRGNLQTIKPEEPVEREGT